MATIKLLSDHLISQIAAGEVVERPASVVKELVENALDAGATSIAVELESGGKRRIRIVDDGRGMDREDALLAFDRHATSKIQSFDDLQQVASLGFRGEALASIAAVAKVELSTSGIHGEGWRVRVEGGRIKVAEPTARSLGTTLEVSSLFFNVPARRKFLKQPRTELRRATEVIQGYALARPDVKFSLRHEGRLLLEAHTATFDDAGLRRRISDLFGRGLADELHSLPAGGGPGESIEGLIGCPSRARGRRLFVFVNGRMLKDRAILATFYQSVRQEWHHDDFPPLFLFVRVPPEDLDVNVHPQKAEVRFRDMAVLDRIRLVLRQGLSEARGEEQAPLRRVDDSTVGPLSWEGLGTSVSPLQTSSSRMSVGEVREPFNTSSYSNRIGQAEQAPRAPTLVPLSGRNTEDDTLRILGQYKGALVLIETPTALWLVDQHAAHERILYERLRSSFAAQSPERQRLLQPRVVEVSAAEMMRLEEMTPALDVMGFEVRALSDREFGIVALPAELSPTKGEELLLSLVIDGGDQPKDPQEVAEVLLENLSANRACRNAIKIHHPLPGDEMRQLIQDLFECEQPWACPHGRPTVLKMEDSELERRFGRRG